MSGIRKIVGIVGNGRYHNAGPRSIVNIDEAAAVPATANSGGGGNELGDCGDEFVTHPLTKMRIVNKRTRHSVFKKLGSFSLFVFSLSLGLLFAPIGFNGAEWAEAIGQYQTYWIAGTLIAAFFHMLVRLRVSDLWTDEWDCRLRDLRKKFEVTHHLRNHRCTNRRSEGKRDWDNLHASLNYYGEKLHHDGEKSKYALSRRLGLMLLLGVFGALAFVDGFVIIGGVIVVASLMAAAVPMFIEIRQLSDVYRRQKWPPVLASEMVQSTDEHSHYESDQLLALIEEIQRIRNR